VAERATGWLEHWRSTIGRSGFYPFDAIAAAFVLQPDLLACARVSLRAGPDRTFGWPFSRSPALLADSAIDRTAPESTLASGSAVYCPQVSAAMSAWLSTAL
jgi:hypothetical protein